ncbi:MAG: phosphoglucosamine mutase, partial [archaeon GB-1867-097]|nr:phosphoglucosamine mutase [Candidatus Culexmicrobium thermophilum]
VTPVSSSKLIEKIAEKYGGKVIWTRVGSVNVSHELKRVKGLMGMEENGGIIYPKHQYVRDGGMATALILEILSEENKTLSELIRELPKYYNFKEKVKCPNNLKSKVMEKVMKEVGRGMERRIETIDGVKLWIDDDTWILIRASGTEPIIRIYSEAKEERKARRNVEEYKRKVREIIKQIGG